MMVTLPHHQEVREVAIVVHAIPFVLATPPVAIVTEMVGVEVIRRPIPGVQAEVGIL